MEKYEDNSNIGAATGMASGVHSAAAETLAEIGQATPKRSQKAADRSQHVRQLALEQLQKAREETWHTLTESPDAGSAELCVLASRAQAFTTAIETLKKDLPTPSKDIYRFCAVVLVVLLSGSLLLIRRPKVSIALEGKATELSFTLGNPLRLFQNLAAVESIELLGLQRIQQPDSTVLADFDDGLLLRVDSRPDSGQAGQIGLDALVLPAGTHVTLSATGAPREIAIDIQVDRPQLTMPLEVAGDFSVSVPRNFIREMIFKTPTRFICESAGSHTRIVLAFKSPTNVAISTPFLINSLSWLRVSRTGMAGVSDTSEASAESAIVSGQLFLEDLKRPGLTLRKGEFLRLKPTGYIRELRFDGTLFGFALDGTTKEIVRGVGQNPQNLLPTWLEWLRRRDALVQFWAFVAYAAGLGFTALKGLKGLKP